MKPQQYAYLNSTWIMATIIDMLKRKRKEIISWSTLPGEEL